MPNVMTITIPFKVQIMSGGSFHHYNQAVKFNSSVMNYQLRYSEESFLKNVKQEEQRKIGNHLGRQFSIIFHFRANNHKWKTDGSCRRTV